MAEKVLKAEPTGEFREEDLKAIKRKEVEENKRIIQDLNKIKYPLQVTVFKGSRPWTIRNIAFWEAIRDKDEKVLEFMEKYLKTEI